MKVTAVSAMPAAPSNLSNEEFAQRVEAEFPALQGTLKELLERFHKLLGLEYLEGLWIPDKIEVGCPCCGSQLKIDIEQE